MRSSVVLRTAALGAAECPHRHLRVAIRLRLLATRLAAAVVASLVLTSGSRWSLGGASGRAAGLFTAGVACALLAFAGRAWALCHIGGRKKRQLVVTGPYALCRHPLYASSLLAGLGLMLATRRLSLVLLYALLTWLLMPPAIRAEEEFLARRFPGWAGYRQRVPALWPRWTPQAWVAPAGVDLRALGRGVLESLAVLLPIGLLELLDRAQVAGAVPSWFLLP